MSNKPKVDPDSLVYAVADLPKVLGVSAGTIRNILKSGDLPARKFGRRTVVLRTDVAAFLANLPLIAQDRPAAALAPAPATSATHSDGRTKPSPLDLLIDAQIERELDQLNVRFRRHANANEAQQ